VILGVAIDLAILLGVQLFAARLFGRSLFGTPSLLQAPLTRLLVVLAAGPVVVYVLAAGLLFAHVLVAGEQVSSLEVEPIPGKPAELAGVAPGDRVVSVSGQRIDVWEQVPEQVRARGGEPVELVVDRGGRPLSFTITPEQGAIGVRSRVVRRSLPLPTAAARALSMPAVVTASVLDALTGSVQAEVSGPVAIVRHVAGAGSRGAVLFVAASVISVGLVPALVVDLGLLGVLWIVRRRAA
jgi:membrane-associated protease RseP (regulator of RpoE activity)